MEFTKIPPKIRTKIIPNQDLSVLDIQKIPFLKISITKNPSPQIQNFLSRLTPNTNDITEISLLPMPSEALLKDLLKCPGMRKKVANKLYNQFWRHNDDDGSDDDTVLP